MDVSKPLEEPLRSIAAKLAPRVSRILRDSWRSEQTRLELSISRRHARMLDKSDASAWDLEKGFGDSVIMCDDLQFRRNKRGRITHLVLLNEHGF